MTKIFLPEENYEITAKDISNRNKGKLLYTMKLLKVMEQAFREIRNKQNKTNTIARLTKIYREKVIEVVDDFVYFNRKKLEMKDLKGEIMKIESSIETDTEQSVDSSTTSEADSNSGSSSNSKSQSGISEKPSSEESGLSLNENKPSHSIEESELDNPDGTLNLKLAEELVKDSGKGKSLEVLETKSVSREELREFLIQ